MRVDQRMERNGLLALGNPQDSHTLESDILNSYLVIKKTFLNIDFARLQTPWSLVGV